MGTVAYRTWDNLDEDPDAPKRWDDPATVHDPALLSDLAKEHADRLRLMLMGYESALSTSPPSVRANARAKYAPMYYDFHRASLASDPNLAKHHMKTALLAQAIASSKPTDLPAAQVTLGDLGTPADISEQYMLWKHSLLPVPVRHWPDKGASVRHASALGLVPRSHGQEDLEALDQRLNATFGPQTRSPQMARVAFAHAPQAAFLRGVTTQPEGNMLLGKVPGDDERTHANNGKTMVEEMAHSLIERHLRDERKSFDKWLQLRTAHQANKRAHMTDASFVLGDDEHRNEMAHALAHGLFDQPGMAPTDPTAPADDSIAYLARLFRMQPRVPAERFRSFPT